MARKCTKKCAAHEKLLLLLLFFLIRSIVVDVLPFLLPDFTLSFFFLDLIFSLRKL